MIVLHQHSTREINYFSRTFLRL